MVRLIGNSAFFRFLIEFHDPTTDVCGSVNLNPPYNMTLDCAVF